MLNFGFQKSSVVFTLNMEGWTNSLPPCAWWGHPVYMCFVDLGFLAGPMGDVVGIWVNRPIVMALWSLFEHSKSCVHMLGIKLSVFLVAV